MTKRLLAFSLLLWLLAALLWAEEQHVVTVYGQRVPFLYDSHRQVIVLEKAVLQRLPGLTLPALIGMAANIPIIERGLFQADSQLAGFNQEQLLVMVNGVPINNSQTGHHNLVLPFDLSQVERVEISANAFSSLSGSAGAAGAINIVTAPGVSASLTGGSFGTRQASLGLRLGPWGISSGMATTEGYLEGLDGRKFFVQAAGRIPAGAGQLDVWGGWTSAAFGAYHFYAPYDSYEKLSRLLSIVKWLWPIDARTALEARFSFQLADDDYSLIRDDPGFYENRHKTWQESMEIEVRRYGRGFSFRAGAAVWADQIHSRGLRSLAEAAALGDHARSWYSLMAEASQEAGAFYFNSGLRLTGGGVRDLGGHVLLGACLTSSLRINALLFRNFRVPTYTELYYNDPTHLANPGLTPERTWGLSLSLTRGPDEGRSEARLFFSRSDDLIDWVGDGNAKAWRSQNIGRAVCLGLELRHSFDFRLARLSVLYTYQRTEFPVDRRTDLLKYRYYSPDHSLALQLDRDSKAFSFFCCLKAERERVRGKLNVYVSLRLGKVISPFLVHLDVLNLLNVRAEKVPGLPEAPLTLLAGFDLCLRNE